MVQEPGSFYDTHIQDFGHNGLQLTATVNGKRRPDVLSRCAC